MADQLFTYVLRGSLVAPEGSKLNATGTGVTLPDGRELKMWEQFELNDGEDYENLDFQEVEALGCFFDGGLTEFEAEGDIHEGDTIYPRT